jgi:hypothetical protein
MAAALDVGCGAFPSHEPLHAERAALLAHRGLAEEALADARIWPDSLWSARLQLRLQWLERRSGEPSPAEATVARADPADPILFEVRAARLRRQPEALLRLCDDVLASDPTALHVLYPRSIALATLGRAEEAGEAMDFQRLLHVVDLNQFDESFLEAVAAEVRNNRSLQEDPTGHATVNGLRTRVFPAAGDAAAPVLMDAIREEAGRYADGLAGDHPFLSARPRHATFTKWALLFKADSYQRVHTHPGSWATGVFYVKAPGGSPRPGRIRFGGFPDWAEVPPPWPIIEHEPEPGRLIVFPSFVPHETVPTGSDGQRISIAFDVSKAA